MIAEVLLMLSSTIIGMAFLILVALAIKDARKGDKEAKGFLICVFMIGVCLVWLGSMMEVIS